MGLPLHTNPYLWYWFVVANDWHKQPNPNVQLDSLNHDCLALLCITVHCFNTFSMGVRIICNLDLSPELLPTQLQTVMAIFSLFRSFSSVLFLAPDVTLLCWLSVQLCEVVTWYSVCQKEMTLHSLLRSVHIYYFAGSSQCYTTSCYHEQDPLWQDHFTLFRLVCCNVSISQCCSQCAICGTSSPFQYTRIQLCVDIWDKSQWSKKHWEEFT